MRSFASFSLIAIGLALSGPGPAHALSLSDFTKVTEGNGAAVDLNDANVVLLQADAGAFTLLDLGQRSQRTVALDASLRAQGFTDIVARDLNNRGQVAGELKGFLPEAGAVRSGFVWSPATGFQLCPADQCGDFVNDQGLAAATFGFWSAQDGARADSVAGYLKGFNNLGQRSFVRPPAGSPQGIVGDAIVAIDNADGVNAWTVRFPVSASSESDPNYAQAIPDTVVINDTGLVAVGFEGVKSNSSASRLYSHGGAFVTTLNGAVQGMNNRGQMVTSENLNNVTGMGPQYATLAESINLKEVVGILPLARINDSGVILQRRGSTFAVFQGPNLSGRPNLPPFVLPEEPTVPSGSGQGLLGDYFNVGLFGNKLITSRVENPDFEWGTGRPAPGVYANAFVVRWTGFIQAEEAGSYQLQTISDEGVRVTLNGQLVINNWKAHRLATDTSAAVTLQAGQRLPIVIDYYDVLGAATLRLKWRKPGSDAFTSVPTSRLYPPQP